MSALSSDGTAGISLSVVQAADPSSVAMVRRHVCRQQDQARSTADSVPTNAHARPDRRRLRQDHLNGGPHQTAPDCVKRTARADGVEQQGLEPKGLVGCRLYVPLAHRS